MMDNIELINKRDEFNKKALDIIAKRGLDFAKFFLSSTYYDYNMSLSCTQKVCKRVSANEYLILKAVIKRDYDLLEVLK